MQGIQRQLFFFSMSNRVIFAGLWGLFLLAACTPEVKNPEKMVKLDQLQEQTGFGISDLDKAIRSSPKEAGLYKLRGRLQLQQKEYSDALESIDKALKLQPEQGEYHYMRARALRALGNSAEALASARHALDFNILSGQGDWI